VPANQAGAQCTDPISEGEHVCELAFLNEPVAEEPLEVASGFSAFAARLGEALPLLLGRVAIGPLGK